MTSFAHVLSALALCGLVGAPLRAQQNRDTGQRTVGSGSLSGRVTSAADASVPVGRALIVVSGGGLGGDRAVVADDDGRFTIDSLPVGSFTVTASKPAYLSSSFGAKRPARPGTPVALAAGQHITGLDIRLTKGGVLAGTVHTADGTPVPGLQILALRQGDPPPRIGMAASDTDVTVTDDRGSYRIYGLVPGAYTVVGLVTGFQVSEMHRRSAAELDAEFREAQQKGAAPTPPPAPLPTFTAAPIFFPGTPVASEASVITVEAASVHDDVSFVVEPVPSVAIDGIVQRPPGMTGHVGLLISGDRAPIPLAPLLAPRLFQSPGSDGRFRYVGVTPGHYTISAFMTDVAPGGPGPIPTPTPPSGGRGSSPPASSAIWWASAEVDVNGQDTAGASLILQPGMTLSGHVSVDLASPHPTDFKGLRVTLDPAIGSSGMQTVNGTAYGGPERSAYATVATDGTFQMSGLTPGTYRLTVGAPNSSALAGIWVRSAMVSGRDALDTELVVEAGQNVDGVTVILTDRHTEMSGRLETPAGQPATEYFVIALPTDRTLWLPNARRIKSTRPATDGQYAFADLPAGSYVLAAVDDLQPQDLADPTFLAAVASSGVPVSLAEGGTTRQDLKLAGGGATDRRRSAAWLLKRSFASAVRVGPAPAR